MKKADFWGLPSCIISPICRKEDFLDSLLENGEQKAKYFRIDSLKEEMIKAQRSKDPLKQSITVSKIFFSVFSFYYERFGNNSNWKFVKWEDVALNPLREFENLFGWLGIKFDESAKSLVLSTSQANSTQSAQRHSTKRNSMNELKDWKQVLSVEEAEFIFNETLSFVKPFYPSLSRWEDFPFF